MEIVSDNGTGRPVCAAVQLANYVDGQLNSAAIQEAAEATSETQESGADLGEGSAYLDDTVVEFTEQSVACGLCQGVAKLYEDGSVDAGRCPVSGSCEAAWAERYPQNYKDEEGELTAKRLPCGAEIGCAALITLVDANGRVELSLDRGACEIAKRGVDWQKTANEAWGKSTLFAPEDGIATFDGAGSHRETEDI